MMVKISKTITIAANTTKVHTVSYDNNKLLNRSCDVAPPGVCYGDCGAVKYTRQFTSTYIDVIALLLHTRCSVR